MIVSDTKPGSMNGSFPVGHVSCCIRLSTGISGVPPLVDGGSITVPMFGAFSTGAMAGAGWEAHNRQGDDALEWENEQIGTFPGSWLVIIVACLLANTGWCCSQPYGTHIDVPV
jgi:hypothetical protein